MGEDPSREGSVASVASPSLGARLDAISRDLAAVLAELDPALLTGRDACGVYLSFAGMERLVVGAKALLAPRIDASGIWKEDGHRSAPSMLAAIEGVSAGQARTTLEVGHRLGQLPATEDAVRRGTLSGSKVTELTGALVLDPDRESELLSGAAGEPLSVVKDRCRQSRATSAGSDPIASVRRIHASRYFSYWLDPEGAFCYQGKDTADRGAQILDRIAQVTNGLRRARRSADPSVHEPEGAVRADAFHALITRRHRGAEGPVDRPAEDEIGDSESRGGDPGAPRRPSFRPKPTAATARPRDGGGEPPGAEFSSLFDPRPDRPSDADHEPFEGSNGGDSRDCQHGDASLSIIDRPPTCSVMVRVDLAALLRGSVHPGECCVIDNQGPISVPMARDMANDSFLRFVFHEAGDIRAVSHFGRTINRQLRTALAHRDKACVVPGCGVSFGLEIDHVIPFAEGGPTALENLALS